MNRPRHLAALLVMALAAVPGSAPAQEEEGEHGSWTLVIGLEATRHLSGPFKRQYNDAVEFASHYIYAHLNGLGGLRVPSALFVASIGGERPGEAKAFHPINDFTGRTPAQIAADLRSWFPPRDVFTDFNPFFKRVVSLVRERGLILAPLNIVLLSDGIVHMPGANGQSSVARIDLSQLEFLSRSVTVRLLYAAPGMAETWKQHIKRKRVRLWTQDADVMAGWRRQFRPDLPVARQDRLWTWVQDIVDFRARAAAAF
jgi:hypothetical protein